MGWALFMISVLGLGFAGWAAALGSRNGAHRATIGKRERDLHNANRQLSETAHEFATYKERTDKQLEALRHDISEMQNDLEACSNPDVLRDRLNRLYQKAAGRDPDTRPD